MRCFVTGALDPETVQIETLLRSLGERVVHAATDKGRVHGGTAYKADRVQGTIPLGIDQIVLVECDLPALHKYGRIMIRSEIATTEQGCDWADLASPDWAGGRGGAFDEGDYHVFYNPVPVIRCDHHSPGDPGYGLPPARYWEGSSLGQVCNLLGIDPTPERLMIAAADHCPGPAYRSMCPGVDPAAVKAHRAETRAAFLKRPASAVLADVAAACRALQAAPTVGPCLPGVADLREGTSIAGCWRCRRAVDAPHEEDLCGAHGVGSPYYDDLIVPAAGIPELPEAALRGGLAYLATVTEGGGRKKIVIGGDADRQEHLVRVFMETWAPGQGLVDVYGDPARGYAGAYVPERKKEMEMTAAMFDEAVDGPILGWAASGDDLTEAVAAGPDVVHKTYHAVRRVGGVLARTGYSPASAGGGVWVETQDGEYIIRDGRPPEAGDA